MRVSSTCQWLPLGIVLVTAAATPPAELDQPPNTWVKRSPLPGGPPSPRLGYESSWGYDPRAKLLVRWGGHNQGGGGDSGHEVGVVCGGGGSHGGTLGYDPYTNTWTNRHAPDQPAFRSGGNLTYGAARRLHLLFGAQFIDDSHTWAYDLRANRWRD